MINGERASQSLGWCKRGRRSRARRRTRQSACRSGRRGPGYNLFNGHGIRIGELLATDALVLVAGEMQSNLGPSAKTRLVLIGKDVR